MTPRWSGSTSGSRTSSSTAWATRAALHAVREGKATKVSQLTVALSGGGVRRGLQPGRRPPAGDQRHRPEPAPRRRTPAAPRSPTARLTDPPATTPSTGVSAAAYTNNDLDTDTATTLFDLDTALDQVAVQAPANAGSLSATGKLGVDAGSDAGFDIAGKDNRGWATLSVGGKYRLYSVSLLTGEVTSKGSFPGSAPGERHRRADRAAERPSLTRSRTGWRSSRRTSRTPTFAHEEGVREAYAAHGAELYRFALRGLGDAATRPGRGAGDLPAGLAGAGPLRPSGGRACGCGSFGIARNVVIDLHRAHGARPWLRSLADHQTLAEAPADRPGRRGRA